MKTTFFLSAIVVLLATTEAGPIGAIVGAATSAGTSIAKAVKSKKGGRSVDPELSIPRHLLTRDLFIRKPLYIRDNGELFTRAPGAAPPTDSKGKAQAPAVNQAGRKLTTSCRSSPVR